MVENHILFTDNWYTSIFVVIQLLLCGIYSIGTVLPNRKGLPKNRLLKKSSRTARGNMEQISKTINGALTYAHVYVCMYVCMNVRMYVCMYVCMHEYMHVCMYVCMCV